jgi:hypothetical protein
MKQIYNCPRCNKPMELTLQGEKCDPAKVRRSYFFGVTAEAAITPPRDEGFRQSKVLWE